MIDVTKPRKQPLPAPPSDDAPEADHMAHAERWLRHSGRLDPGIGLGDFTGTVVA